MASFIARKGPGGRRVWQAHIRRRGFPAQVRTFDTKTEAQAWAAMVESEIVRGVFVSRTEAEATSLAEGLERYQDEIVPAKKQSDRERRRVDELIRQLGPLATRPLAGIRGKDIMTYIKDRSTRGAGGNTVRLDLALLSHLFNVARTAWGMESLSNPVELVKGQRPKLPLGRTRRLVGGEEVRLLEAARTYGGEIGPIITWAIETAMRRGEIAAMRWEHLDRKARVLLIPETKTGTPRRVPLSSKALQVLDTLPRQIDGRVWSMRPDSISQAFERVVMAARTDYESECKQARQKPDAKLFKDLRFHDLRHEATSRLFEKGLNPMEVAAITGHKTLQMLKRYTHLKAEDLVGMLG